MERSRIAAATVVVLSVAWLVSTPAAAEQSARQLTTSPQPTLSAAAVSMDAITTHGPTKHDAWNIVDDPHYTETRQSNYSGTYGTESAVVAQDSSIDTFDDGGTPRVQIVTSTGDADSAVTSKPFGGGSAFAQAGLDFTVQSAGPIHVVVEGALITSHNAGDGCASVQLQVFEGDSLFDGFHANSGVRCATDEAAGHAVVEEFQLLPGSARFQLVATNIDISECPDVECGPTSKGSAHWDFTFVFCSNSYTDGSDLVLGTTGNDVLCGGLGADEISGGDGDDVLWGDAGNDIMSGGLGNDLIEGEGGNDELWGDSQEDCARVDDGDDTLDPGPGDDEMHGCGGDDFLLQGSSLGVLAYGGLGLDTMAGGRGPDFLWGGPGADLIGGFGGADKLYGEGGNDQLLGHAGGDRLTGGAGNRDYCRPGNHPDDRRFSCER